MANRRLQDREVGILLVSLLGEFGLKGCVYHNYDISRDGIIFRVCAGRHMLDVEVFGDDLDKSVWGLGDQLRPNIRDLAFAVWSEDGPYIEPELKRGFCGVCVSGISD